MTTIFLLMLLAILLIDIFDNKNIHINKNKILYTKELLDNDINVIR